MSSVERREVCCDRCAIIAVVPRNKWPELWGQITRSEQHTPLDLCGQCYTEFNKFMGQEK